MKFEKSILEILRQARDEVYGEEAPEFNELFRRLWEGEDELAAEVFATAAAILASNLTGRKVYYYWHIIPPIPDAYAPEESLWIILVTEDGQCLTLQRHGEEGAGIGVSVEVRDLDTAVKALEDIARIISSNLANQ